MSRFGMKWKDAAPLLKLTTPKLIKILKEEGVILNTNGRNMPIPLYVQRGWFVIENIEFWTEQADGGRNKWIAPTVIITNKGFYEMERIVIRNRFQEFASRNIFNDIQIFVREFFRDKKRAIQETITVENERFVEIYHSTKKKTELILKYKIDEQKIWIPRIL